MRNRAVIKCENRLLIDPFGQRRRQSEEARFATSICTQRIIIIISSLLLLSFWSSSPLAEIDRFD